MTDPREEFADVGQGITLCFEQIGDADATPLLLVAGPVSYTHLTLPTM